MAAADVNAIEAAIAEVTFPEPKARHIVENLRYIAIRHPEIDLDFLSHEPLPKVLAWLRALPGVGPKVAASTVNFSTLERPSLVMDTHTLRVFGRIGVIAAGTRCDTAYDLLMSALQTWTAPQLGELHVLVKHLGQRRCHAGFMDCRNCPVNGISETWVGC